MKKIILLLTIIFSVKSYSQIPIFHNHGGGTEKYNSFLYKYQYYEARPSGLKTFLNENEMDPKLKITLTEKMQRIRNRDLISKISGWGLWITASGIMLNEGFSKYKQGKNLNGSTLVTGLGVAILGGLLKEFIRPKDKHYNDFINTFNRKESEKIKFDITCNYNESLNFGLAVSF